MSTLKANNQAQATKELQAIDKTLVENVNFNIKKTDEGNYHVALVRITERPGQVKNKVSITTHQYNKRAFPKAKKQVVFMGYAHAIILHDPTIKAKKQAASPKPEAKKEETPTDKK